MNKQERNKLTSKEAFEKMVNGIEEIINRGEYQQFLKFSKYFHNYSFGNVIMIYLQKEDATRVAGYKTWEKMNRKIKKGEKGIQIYCPIKLRYNKTKREYISDKGNQQTNTDDEIVEYLTYRAVYVFDISQTEGEEMPLEDKFLNSCSKKELLEQLYSFSPYHIISQKINENISGYWSPQKKHIVLKEGLSIDDKDYSNYLEDFCVYNPEIELNNIYELIDSFENPKLVSALKSLSDIEQTVIFLLYEKKMTSQEISTKLKICSDSVTRINRRSIKKIKKFLNEEE